MSPAHVCNQMVNDNISAQDDNMSSDFNIHDSLITMVNEDLTSNADCSADTSFRTIENGFTS